MDFAGAGTFADMYGNASHVWVLVAPDGREVSVKEAMTKLAAQDIRAAQRWLETHK